MKKYIAQALSFALALTLIAPIPVPPGGEDTPPDEPGISVCGDDWRDSNTRE